MCNKKKRRLHQIQHVQLGRENRLEKRNYTALQLKRRLQTNYKYQIRSEQFLFILNVSVWKYTEKNSVQGHKSFQLLNLHGNQLISTL
jgi:hypothetical protein